MSNVPNPYAPPRAEPASLPPSEELPEASQNRRFANLVIDYVCSFAIAVVTFAVMKVVLGPRWGETYTRGSFTLMWLGYYLFFESTFGRTPGKLVTGTRVVSRDGGAPSFLQLVGRSFARVVPFDPLSFLGTPGGGWHDRWSRTRVVLVRPPARARKTGSP